MSSKLFDGISRLIGLVMEYVFPAYCVYCGVGDHFLCEDCMRGIYANSLRFEIVKCGFYIDGLTVCCAYNSGLILRKAIHAFKYQFIFHLSEPLGEVLANYLGHYNSDEFVVCPVPLHPRRLRWRGFNQSLLLAETSSARLVGFEVKELLRRVKYSTPQQGLSRDERIENIRGAFEVCDGGGSGLINKSVILIDDVATTLSTLEECSKVLKDAGYSRVYGIVLARGV